MKNKDYYKFAEFIRNFNDAKEDCILNHSLEKELKGLGVSLNQAKILEKKDHRHTIIPAGKYIVGIQNRFDPMENIKKRVID